MVSEDNRHSSHDDESVTSMTKEELRATAGGNVAVYYYVGDAYRDIFVGVGCLLGSIVAMCAFATFGQISTTVSAIGIFFKLLVFVVAYTATAKRNGKIMIFAAICAGLGTAFAGYLTVTSFTTWSSKQFEGARAPLIMQSIIDLLVLNEVDISVAEKAEKLSYSTKPVIATKLYSLRVGRVISISTNDNRYVLIAVSQKADSKNVIPFPYTNTVQEGRKPETIHSLSYIPSSIVVRAEDLVHIPPGLFADVACTPIGKEERH